MKTKLAVGAVAIAIATAPQFSVAQPTVDGAWRVGTAASAPQMTINGSLLNGHSGCRNFSAEIQGSVTHGRIVVAPLSGTCTSAQQRIERRFLTQLRAVRSLAVRNGRLEARNPRGALLFSAARVAPSASAVMSAKPEGNWRPVTVANRASVPLSGSVQTVRIAGSKFLLEGHCNTYGGVAAFGPVSNGAGSFAIFISEQSQQMCADERLEVADSELLAALESARFFQLTKTDLRLTDASGKNVASFRLM